MTLYKIGRSDLLKNHELVNSATLSIGGIGGSGTRLFVNICEALGFDFGENALRLGGHDNLLFTHLFKRPEWFKNLPDEDDFSQTASVFGGLSTGAFDDTIFQSLISSLQQIGQEHDRFERPTGSGTGVVDALVETYKHQNGRRKWAWKEPNTHIFIDRLLPFFPTMKYIHVVRHGLDMAFSNNQQQFLNWSKALTGHAPDLAKPLAPQMLDYWLFSEIRVAKLQTAEQFQNRILRVDYDRLCTDPTDGIGKIVRFLGESADASLVGDIQALIKPTSQGRYRDEDLTIFSVAQLQAVERLGFQIDRQA